MAAARSLLRSQTVKPYFLESFRSLSTTTAAATTNPSAVQSLGSSHHPPNHEFLPANKFVNSWKPPKDPKEAEAKLALLRRDYAKQVKEVRKEYVQEIELQKLEKQRMDEARKEALRIANEERKAMKAAKKRALAVERQAAEEEFRRTLLKETAEKLEYWRMKENQVEEKKKENNELLRRQSSMWIDEPELEKRILEAIVDSTPL